MRGRAAIGAAALLAAALLAAGCARRGAPPPTPPAPPPPTEEVVRRNPWLARHFDELTPRQQARVTQRMARARPPIATTREDARLRWDAMGLEERRMLIAPAAGRRVRRATAPPRRPATTGSGAPAQAGGQTAGRSGD